jgi:hypothetical protein
MNPQIATIFVIKIKIKLLTPQKYKVENEKVYIIGLWKYLLCQKEKCVCRSRERNGYYEDSQAHREQ